jgi:CO/xanthine dehydrogenase Mo-binding subunit
MATYTERCGGGFPETASIEFKDDDHVELVMGNQEYGTGLVTAYKQVVSGGIVQGIGQALLEHAVYDDGSGQLLSGSFMDYAMPRAGDIPSFAFSTHNVPTTSNPLGVKGAGEAGAVGTPPAVINAVVDALSRRSSVRQHRHAGNAAAGVGSAERRALKSGQTSRF